MDSSNGQPQGRGPAALWVVMQLVHFVGGSVSSLPVSFHASEAEATKAKDAVLKKLKSRVAAANKDLLEQLSIGAIHFEVGCFQGQQEQLIEVPRLVIPVSH